jgi:hypothetical protein
MDKEMIQRVLDFIREGAIATSGPAKWGFDQVCAYRANVAMGELITLAIAVILSLAVVICLVPSVRKGMDTRDSSFWYEFGAPVVCTTFSVICVISASALLERLPTDLATIRNPAGSVLSGLTK